jgi:hypothetical protein
MVPILLLAAALHWTAFPPQASTADERRLLSDIRGIDVVVEPLDPSADAEGLSSDQLKTEAQLKLGSAGIKVGTKFEPYLDIQVVYAGLYDKTRQNMSLGFVASVILSLKQLVCLPRNQALKALARTWHREVLVSGPPGQGKERVREAVGHLVDKFIDDYLTVNPKP